MSQVKIKITTFITSILLLFAFVFSSVTIPEVTVMAEGQIDPYEELVSSGGFDENDWKGVKDITVIDFCEEWKLYYNNDVGVSYIVYIYNPTSAVLKDSTDDKIHISTSSNSSFTTYDLSLISTSSDGKYIKYEVKESSSIWELVKDTEKRYYDVSRVDLVKDNDRTPTNYAVGYRYLYSANNGQLDVVKEKYDVVRVDNLTPMVYRNLKSGIYNYPSGQINSVAFTIDNDIINEYGEISEIHFEYYKYKTSPIVVSGGSSTLHEDRSNWVGYTLGSEKDYNKPAITWGDVKITSSQLNPKTYYDYTYNSYDAFGHSQHKIKSYNKLCYSFSSGSENPCNYTVSSEELEEWIYGYYDNYYRGREDAVIHVKDGKIPKELFEDYTNEKYGYKDVKLKAETLGFTEQKKDFWNYIFGGSTGYSSDYDTIQKINSDDYQSLSSSVFADKYKVNESFSSTLGNLSTSAESAGKSAYVFHFDLSDYYTAPGASSNYYVAQTAVYLNFTFIDFTFVKDDVATVLAVDSDIIDIFPSVEPPVVSSGNSCSEVGFMKIIAIVLIVLVVVVLFKPVIVPLLELVIKIILLPISWLFSNKNNKNNKGRK